MTSNRSIGNKFEQYVAELLKKDGFWVHNANLGKAGQPVDLIAVRKDEAFLIEVKYLSKHRKEYQFPYSRLEDNQILAMDYYLELGNNPMNVIVAIGFKDQLYMIPWFLIRMKMETHIGIHHLGERDITTMGKIYHKWVENKNVFERDQEEEKYYGKLWGGKLDY